MVRKAAVAVAAGRGLAEPPDGFAVSRPKRPAHGDFACNVGFVLAGPWKMAPPQVSALIIEAIEASPHVAAIEPAGGYLNFRLSPAWWTDSMLDIGREGARYGWNESGGGEKLQVEFVSANPTGPLHVGHGRYAAYGDSLARILATQGFDVQREFYVNDHGTQMDIFGRSIAARYGELFGETDDFPEDGYRGAYIIDIAKEIAESDGDAFMAEPFEERALIFRERAYAQVLEHLKKVLAGFRVEFDVWFSERTVHENGELQEVVGMLRDNGLAYEEEGAVWFRSTSYGDDKDRVLIRSDGQPTYFSADIAYHYDKSRRGFKTIIDVWGADHHGYVARMAAFFQALALPSRFEVVIGQMVSLWRSGEPVRLSKRTGEMITLEELVDEVGVDAARYFLVMRGPDTALDFDLDLAREESADNPVYYVQYAHARICSIIRTAAERGLSGSLEEPPDLTVLLHEQELALMKKLAAWPEVLAEAASLRAVQRVPTYAQELAATFHLFYRDCRVLCDVAALSQARLYLALCARRVLASALELVGVSAPERM